MHNTSLLPINLPIDLNRFNLLWDLGEGYISTFCMTRKISNEVTEILNSHKIPAHPMHTDNRIIVIYFESNVVV